MALYSAIGIGLGFYFINMLDEEALRRGLGVFLILYSLYALATRIGCRDRGRRRASRDPVRSRRRSDLRDLFQHPSVGAGDFPGDHEHGRAARWCRAYRRLCPPRVLRRVERCADRDRLAAG